MGTSVLLAPYLAYSSAKSVSPRCELPLFQKTTVRNNGHLVVSDLPKSEITNRLNNMVSHEWRLTIAKFLTIIFEILLSKILSIRRSCKVIHHDLTAAISSLDRPTSIVCYSVLSA